MVLPAAASGRSSWAALATLLGEKSWGVAMGPGWGGAETLVRDGRGVWEGSFREGLAGRARNQGTESEQQI